ncbi:MAG: hypothetical protein ABUL62_02895 [Myxococcales bacterium]
MLSALAHGKGNPKTAVAIAHAAYSTLGLLPDDRQMLYFALIESALGDAARKAFEMLPEEEKIVERFIAERQARYVAKVRATEKSADVIAVLEARGLAVSEAQKQRIVETADLETLSQWVRRAATIAETSALFE